MCTRKKLLVLAKTINKVSAKKKKNARMVCCKEDDVGQII